MLEVADDALLAYAVVTDLIRLYVINPRDT
jgi:hypothetical protein